MSGGTILRDRTADVQGDVIRSLPFQDWVCFICNMPNSAGHDKCEVCSSSREATGSMEPNDRSTNMFSFGFFNHRSEVPRLSDDSDAPQESDIILTDTRSAPSSLATTESMSTSTPKSDLNSPSSDPASMASGTIMPLGGVGGNGPSAIAGSGRFPRRGTAPSTPETESPRSNGSEVEAVMEPRGVIGNGPRRRYTRSGSSTPMSEGRMLNGMERIIDYDGACAGEEMKMRAFQYIFQFRTKVCHKWLTGVSCNATTCLDSHSKFPTRRAPVELEDGTWSYAPKPCAHTASQRDCPMGANCQWAHSDDEMYYHPLTYRTAQCTRSKENPAALSCLYGAHCWHAHSEHELRHPRGMPVGTITVPPHAPPPQQRIFVRDDPSSAVGLPTSEPLTDEQRCYFMFEYKTGQCLRPVCQCGQICDAYHSATERRRSPRDWSYTEHPCPRVKMSAPESRWGSPELCPDGDACRYSHTRLEQMYHPNTYKTSLCNRAQGSGGCAWGLRCSHAHGQADLSKPERSFMLAATMDRSLYQQGAFGAPQAATAPPRKHVVVTRQNGAVVTFPTRGGQPPPATRGPASGPGAGRGGRPASLLPPQQQQQHSPRGVSVRTPGGLQGGSLGTPGGASSGGRSPFPGEDPAMYRFPMAHYEDMQRELEEYRERDRIRGIEAEQLLQREVMIARQLKTCPNCGDMKRDKALVPCGHVVCGTCAASARSCPLCHAAVSDTLALRF